MKLTINTNVMQELVSKAVKGASNNRLLPITSLLGIELKDGQLVLTTTDGTNYLYVRKDKVVGDNFYTVISADTFAKLVSKTTSENLVLELTDSYLRVTGNGTYNIELPMDENGQMIKYPDPAFAFLKKPADKTYTWNKSTVQVILETLKPALALTFDNPQYTGYYVGKSIVATDTYKIANMDVALFDDAKLIFSQTMDLLDVMSDEKISVFVRGDEILFSTAGCVVNSKVMTGIEDYSIDAISSLVEEQFDSKCSIPRAEFLRLLDRLSLFVGTYDDNAVTLTFTKSGLQVSSKSSSGVEIIPYIASENFIDFICDVDIALLTQEIKAIKADAIELYYGVDTSIKMIDGNITIIVALLETEE